VILLLKALPVLVLALGLLFAWRARRAFPHLALCGALVAVAAGALLLRTPVLLVLGLTLAAGLIAWRRD
jgi:hypothetical protein